MGSRVVARAIKDLVRSDHRKPSFKDVVFAAPEIDETNFDQASPALTRSSERVTLYVSHWDVALALPSDLHEDEAGGFKLLDRPGMDVINTTGWDTSTRRVNHHYLFDSQILLTDLAQLMNGMPPAKRIGLEKASSRDSLSALLDLLCLPLLSAEVSRATRSYRFVLRVSTYKRASLQNFNGLKFVPLSK
jgi:hypothetical protein